MPAGLTTEQWIKKVQEKHGDKYDYSKVVYSHRREKVTIICPVHGEFQQLAQGHYDGKGCLKCGRKRMADSCRMTFGEFVEKARKIHGGLYLYDEATFSDIQARTLIVCPAHGTKCWQRPVKHLVGHRPCTGCRQYNRKWNGKKPPVRKRKTTEQFIADAKTVHGDRFDYSLTQYTGCHNYITVICREHGPFQQMATNHISGYGCSQCSASQQIFHENHIPESERDDPAYVYVLEIGLGEEADELFAKLGYSSNFDYRIYRLHHDNVRVWKSHVIRTTKYKGFQVERLLHAQFADRRVDTGRRFGGMTECYPIQMHDELLYAVKTAIWGTEPAATF